MQIYTFPLLSINEKMDVNFYEIELYVFLEQIAAKQGKYVVDIHCMQGKDHTM